MGARDRGASRNALFKLLAVFLGCALIAASCGDSDEGATGDAGGSEDTSGSSTTAGEGSEGDEEGEPVQGGRLVYGLEADSANPWAHYRTSCAASCLLIFQGIADPLMYANTDGEVVPYLLESIEPNEDYTEWTMTIRDGITFHDGTPLDAEAVAFNINACRGSALTGPAYSNLASVVGEGQTVTLTTANSPWVALPTYFAGGSCSFMFSKEWLQSLPDVPQRKEGNPVFDAEVAATPATGDPSQPVSVGPFQFVSYTPGNGNSFLARRFEDYWRGPNGITGEQLPYLDEIEYVVAVDIESRSNGLRSGQFDVIHTANSDEIASFQGSGDVEVLASSAFGDTSHIMINNAEGENAMTGAPLDPEGANDDNPLTTLSCRRALAHALDRERFVEDTQAGLARPANGPFPPGSIGHLEDTGYPEYDLDLAQQEMDTCLQERGTPFIEFEFNTTNDPFNVESNTLVVAMWQEAFGDQVRATITPIEQGQYIGLGLTGTFDALAWRNFAGIDPDQQILWWISQTASPIGQLALNFGRISDPVIDENLITIRTNPDPDARREAAENVNRRFGEMVYNFWYYWTVWAAISDPTVNDVDGAVSPEGEALIATINGRHPVGQIWCDGGTCGT